MPRSGKKVKIRNRGFSSSADVTLKDYANSDAGPGKTRMKKAVSNTLVKEAKEICTKPTTTAVDDRDWFEKSLEEFNIDSGPDEDFVECQKGSAGRTRRRKKGNSCSSTSIEEDTGIVYPVDIWFILGSYIKPEDVKTFASICRSAYSVTQTSKFWFRLYRRYYSPDDNLPMRLQPECMERLYGLRTCVIRSLYYFYPLFHDRMKIRKEEDLNTLLKRTCSMLWHQKGRGVYHFYFKLKQYNEEDFFCRPRQPDLIEMLGDINANTEERCKVVQVTSVAFTSIPPTILGQSLIAASSVLSPDLRSHCLRLIFGPPHAIHYSRMGKLAFSHIPEGAIGVSINSVMKVKVLDWWNTAYPHKSDEKKPATTNESSNTPEDVFF